MATRAILTPESAHFPAANAPALTQVNRRFALAYDAATDETAFWTLAAPQGLTGALTLVVSYIMASATANNVVWAAQVEAVTDGDTVDLDAATSFDTANTATDAVPGTAGYLGQASITLTNADGIAAGDYVRIAIFRDADNASDTATGDAYLLAAELRDTA